MDDPVSFKDYGHGSGPSKPTSVRFPRGTKRPGPKEKAPRKKLEKVERIVRQYTDGTLTDGQFKRELKNHGLKADNHINKMIVNHESGDHQHHQAFSKHLLHQLQPANKSNPVNKVTVEEPASYGKDPIQMSEKIDNHYTEQ